LAPLAAALATEKKASLSKGAKQIRYFYKERKSKMAVDFKISAFDVDRCGYYRRGQQEPEFGTLGDTLALLKEWTAGKSLLETKTFEPKEDTDALPIYCFKLHPSANRDSWLLTTWNETPMSEGKVQAAKGDAPVGNVGVSLTDVAPGDIPGFPTYFLLLPDHNLTFCLRPEGLRHNGHQGMGSFLEAYLRLASPYVVLNAGEDADETVDNDILGYRLAKGTPIRQLAPRFRSRPRRLPGEIELLRQRQGDIRKLVRRDTLNAAVVKERDLIGKLLQNVGLLDAQIAQRTMKFGYEIDYTPLPDDFEAIVAAAEDEAVGADSGEIGFRLRGESDTRWLSHAFAKDEWSLPIEPGPDQVFDAEILLKVMDARRDELIALAKAGQ
jgi:hypothetical protein